MAQGDYLIQNQSFPSFRSDLNSTLEAINTSNSGTSRPTSAVAGTVWLDTTNATNPTLKLYDGTDDISLAQFDYSANTVNWLDSTVATDLVNDTTPQLGGDLDVNGNDIVSVSNGNISITPDGTGKVIIDGLSHPTADGTNGQALVTDGAGNLSFASAGLSGWSEDGANNNLLPASASAGIYLGVNSATAANLLDDYEEGTWTPVYKGGSTAGSSPSGGGTYTKIGNLVHVDFSLVNITSTGASGDAIVAGLPFVCNQTNSTRGSFGGGVRFFNHELTGTTRYLMNTFIDDGNSHIAFIQSGDATPWTSLAVDNDSGMFVEGAITYRTDS